MTADQPGIDARSSQGVQVGGGDQYNIWTSERRPDPAILEALNPRDAAKYLAGLSRHDAALLLAAAPAGDSAEVVKAADEDLAISLLTGLKRNKAEELVAAMADPEPWLKLLPTAAEAIARCEAGARRVLGAKTRDLARATPSKRGTQGFRQVHENGVIYWNERGGAFVAAGAILGYINARGGSGGRLGFPLSPEFMQPGQENDTSGSFQRFESDFNYGRKTCELLGLRCGATVYTSRHGTYTTWGGIGEFYELRGGNRGELGFPVGEDIEVGPSRQSSDQPGSTGWCQRFESGAVYYTDKTKAVAVYAPMLGFYDCRGGVYGQLGFPVDSQQEAAESPYGTHGHLQHFEGRRDYPSDILDSRVFGATLYASREYGTHCVSGAIGEHYELMHGTSSWLGFPTSGEIDGRNWADEPPRRFQIFEGGAIFWTEENWAIAVPRSTLELFSEHHGPGQQLGFPVTEAGPLADTQVQLFEHGVVTVRNGKAETWSRSDFEDDDAGWLDLNVPSRLIRALARGPGDVWDVAFSPDGTLLASAGADGTIRLWDPAIGTQLRTLDAHNNIASSLVFSPDGTLLASAGKNETIWLWNPANGRQLRTLTGHTASVNEVAFSPDGTILASAGADRTVRLWNPATGRQLRTITGHVSAALSVAFSLDGTLASAGEDGSIHLWNPADGTRLHTLTGHTAPVNDVAFSPDGTLLVSAGEDGTIRLWNLADGTQLHTLTGYTGPVNDVALSPDGTLLASAGADKTIRLWNPATGLELRALGAIGYMMSVTFSPDGTLLACGGKYERGQWKQTLLLWR